MKRILTAAFCSLLLAAAAFAQEVETLTNAQIVEMSRAGLDQKIILKKIETSRANFDVSAAALVELKKNGVADEVIALMLEKGQSPTTTVAAPVERNYSESAPVENPPPVVAPALPTPQEALRRARSLAIVKSSLNPSRQSLEKELMKRKEWPQYKLSLVRYKEEADLYVEIGRVPLSLITHRYVFRLFDRRSGVVIAAGETTSWGSLAKNLAREMMQKMAAAAGD